MSSLIEITLISHLTLFLHTPVITSYPQSLHFILRNHTFEPFTFFPSLSLHGYLILSLTSSWKSAIQQICFSLNGDKHIYKLPLKIIDKAFEAGWPPTPPAFKEPSFSSSAADWLTWHKVPHVSCFSRGAICSQVCVAPWRDTCRANRKAFFLTVSLESSLVKSPFICVPVSSCIWTQNQRCDKKAISFYFTCRRFRFRARWR